MLTRNQLFLAKIETTFGSDASPAKTDDAIQCEPVDFSRDITKLDYNIVRSSISAAKRRFGRIMCNFTVRVPFKGSGTAGTAPKVGVLLQACAYKQTISAGVSVTYKPTSVEADIESVTIYFYYDGRLVKAVGCRGNWSLDMAPGGYPMMVFSLRGALLEEVDAALLTGATFETGTEPQILQSAGISFGAFDDAVVRSFGIQSGNNLVDRPDLNSGNYGIKGSDITGRDPAWSATVEATVEATKAWWGNQTGRVEEAIDITIGASAGNIATITMAKACIEDGVTPRDDNGRVVFPLTGQALEDSGDDNISIVFT